MYFSRCIYTLLLLVSAEKLKNSILEMYNRYNKVLFSFDWGSFCLMASCAALFAATFAHFDQQIKF